MSWFDIFLGLFYAAGTALLFCHLALRWLDKRIAQEAQDTRTPKPPLSPAIGTWRSVLDPADPVGSYRRLRAKHHPDRGGDADEFHAVQHAWDAYQQEVRRT